MVYDAELQAEIDRRKKNPDSILNAKPVSSVQPKRTVSGTLSDIGATIGKGLVGVPESGIGLARMANSIGPLGQYGPTQLAQKAAGQKPLDPISMGLNALSKPLKTASQFYDKSFSPAQKYAQKQVSDTKGFFPTIKKGLQNPSVPTQAIGESLPAMFAGGGVTRGILKGIPTLAKTSTRRLLASGVGEGVIAMGQAAEGIHDQTGTLTASQTGKAAASGVGTALFTFLGGKAADKMGFADIDSLLAGISKGGKKLTPTKFVATLAQAGISEGLLEEMPQSAQERVFMNSATSKPLMDGVSEAAAMGAITGAPMGIAANAKSLTLVGDDRTKLEKVYMANKDANLKALHKKNLTGSQLASMMDDPDALKEWSIIPSDIQSIIDKDPAKLLEQKDYGTLVAMAPSEAVKSGLTSTTKQETMEALNEQTTQKQQTGQTQTAPEESRKATIDTLFNEAITLNTKAEEALALGDEQLADELFEKSNIAQEEAEKLDKGYGVDVKGLSEKKAKEIVSEKSVLQTDDISTGTNTKETRIFDKESSTKEAIKVLEAELEILRPRAYELARSGKNTDAIYARIDEIESSLEMVPKSEKAVEPTAKDTKGLEFDAAELRTDIDNAPSVESAEVSKDQLDTVNAQIDEKISKGDTGGAANVSQKKVTSFERQLDITTETIAAHQADVNALLEDTAPSRPQGKTRRAAKVEKDTVDQQIPAYLQAANEIPVSQRSLKSLKQEQQFIFDMMRHHTRMSEIHGGADLSIKAFNKASLDAMSNADTTIGKTQLELTERLVEINKEIDAKGQNKGSKQTLKTKSKEPESISTKKKEVSKKKDLEQADKKPNDSKDLSKAQTAIVEANKIQEEIDALQPKIDKARKQKKKSSHLVKQQVDLRIKKDILVRDALASEISGNNTTSSTTSQVETNILDTLNLKKMPSIFKVYETYADFKKDNPKAAAAYEASNTALASENSIPSLQGPKWTSALITDFITGKGTPLEVSADKWLSLLQKWTTDVPKMQAGKFVLDENGKKIQEGWRAITNKKGKTQQVPKFKQEPAEQATDKDGELIFTKGKMPDPVRDEVEFSRLVEWLEDSEAEKISQQDIVNFLQESGIRLPETTQGYDHLIEENFGITDEKDIAERQELEDIITDKLAELDSVLDKAFPKAPLSFKHRVRVELTDDPSNTSVMTTRFILREVRHGSNYTKEQVPLNIADKKTKESLQKITDKVRELHATQNLMDDFMDSLDLLEVKRSQWDYMALYGPSENYREHLINLPIPQRTVYSVYSRDMMMFQAITQKEAEQYIQKYQPKGAMYLIKKEDINDTLKAFTGGHFNTNNLIHIRATSRESSLGDTLFIDEMQSDWHQQLVKYKNELDKAAIEDFDKKYSELSSKELIEFAENKNDFPSLDKAVPDAPFKSNWEKVVMKRMIMQAIIEGKTSVSWPSTADQVAQIEGYGTQPKGDQKGNFWRAPNGQWLALGVFMYEKELQRMWADKEARINFLDGVTDVTPIIERYTKQVPKMMNKWLGQFNSKVETVKLTKLTKDGTETVSTVQGFKITPELKTAAMNGLPMNSIRETKPAGIQYGDEIFLISENIDPDQDMKGLIIHELGHWLRRNDATYEKRYLEMLKQVEKIGKLSTTEGLAIRKASRIAYENNSDRLPDELIAEESLMYFLQDQANTELSLYKKMVSLVKQFLYKHFGVSPVKLNMSGYDMAQTVVSDIKKNLKQRNTATDEMLHIDLVSVPDIKPAMASAKSTEEKVVLKDVFSTSLKSAAKANNIKYSSYTNDVYARAEKSKDPTIKRWVKRMKTIDPNGVAFMRDENTQDPGWFSRLLSSPEYRAKGTKAAELMVEAAEYSDELKYKKQKEVLGDFDELSKAFRDFAPTDYKRAGKYLRKGDRTGIGFKLALEDGVFIVRNTKSEDVSTHDSWEVASEALIQAEQDFLKGRMSKDAREFIKMFRELMDRSLKAQNEDLQNQIDNAKKYGLDEPRVGDPDSPTLSEAIAQSYDLQGTYFPRVRQNKKFYIRMEKDGHPDKLITADFYNIKNKNSTSLVNKIKDIMNREAPVAYDIRKFEKAGYTLTEIEPGAQLAEEVYDTPGLVSSIDAILGQAEDTSSEEDLAAMQHLNNLLTQKVSDIYKVKGNMSSKKSRSESYTEGFEEDPIKAAISHSRRISAGMAKRQTARDMINAFTGRTESLAEFKKRTGKGYKEYKVQVAQQKIDPRLQKNLYGDMKLYMQHVLRPTTKFERTLGYLKAATVVKFLGFRVSSAAINMSNMVAAVPATLSAHTGLDLNRSLALVSDAASRYATYRFENPAFKGYKNSLKNTVMYKTEKAIKSLGKTATKPIKLTDEDHRVFTEIGRRGWDEAHFNIDATKAVQDYAGEAYNNFVAASMYMFGAAERANRAMTIFAAYKAHREVNPELKFEQLLQKAKHTSDRSHGSYGKATKPYLVQKYSILDLPYMFGKFQHNYVLNMVEQGAEYKNYKSMLYMMAIPAVIAGAGASVLSTPAFAILGLLSQALGAGGDDPEEEFYTWMEKNLPKMVAKSARLGVAGVLGVNFKGSMQSPINEVSKLKDIGLLDFGGAPVGALVDEWDALQHLKYGEFSKAIEKALPSAFASPIKAARLATEGYTGKDYSPVFFGQEQLKITTPEIALMSMSFNPARISAYREKQWNEKQTKASFAKDRADMRRLHRRGIVQSSKIDLKRLDKIQSMMDSYNYRVSKSDPNLRETYMTWDKLHKSVIQSLKPNKIERTRL